MIFGCCYYILVKWEKTQNGFQFLIQARNEENGRKALEELAKEGLKPSFYQLDVADDASISQFAEYLKQTHGGIDVLVNNAGIAFDVVTLLTWS